MRVFDRPLTDAELIAKRLDELRAVDEMPEKFRKVFRACDFYLEVPKIRRGVDLKQMIEMVQSIKTQDDANEVNRVFRQMK